MTRCEQERIGQGEGSHHFQASGRNSPGPFSRTRERVGREARDRLAPQKKGGRSSSVPHSVGGGKVRGKGSTGTEIRSRQEGEGPFGSTRDGGT